VKRPAPATDDSDDGPSKKGKAKADGPPGADQLPAVQQSVAMHLAKAREHAQLAKTVLVSFAEAGGDPRLIQLSAGDKALLGATNVA